MGHPVNPNDSFPGASSDKGAPMGSFKAAGANVVGSSARTWGKGNKKGGKKGGKKMGKGY